MVCCRSVWPLRKRSVLSYYRSRPLNRAMRRRSVRQSGSGGAPLADIETAVRCEMLAGRHLPIRLVAHGTEQLDIGQWELGNLVIENQVVLCLGERERYRGDSLAGQLPNRLAARTGRHS